jgi:predicted nucleic acid-binding protein
VDQVNLGTELLDDAADLASGSLLRSLDAIHLASARAVGTDLRAVVTYDLRMADAADALGLVVAAPG